MNNAWLKIITFVVDIYSNISEWWKKRKRINEIDSGNKAVDDSDDVALARKLHEIADKIERRNKTN